MSETKTAAWVSTDATADHLFTEALRYTAAAVAPFSGLCVGAALGLADGSVAAGANLESPSFSLTVHAEAAALVALQARAVDGDIPSATHVLCCTADGEVIPPCGLCRQILMERCGPDLAVATAEGWVRLGDLLPWAFTAENLERTPQP